MKKEENHKIIFLFITILISLFLNSCIIQQIGGASSKKPEELKTYLSNESKKLIERAFSDIDANKLVDYHTHIAGIGTGNSGNFVSPEMFSSLHPEKNLKFQVYTNAAGIKNFENADREYALRLVDLIKNIDNHGKHLLLPFDKNYNYDGTVNLNKTEFYTSNDYVFSLAEEFPELFISAMSVHPYRTDALEELERCAKKGIKIIKWLPNAMGIDPSDSKCEPFYQKVKELNLVMLIHSGEEKAVDAEEDQKLGNPLLLRKPLDLGVKIIVAHCAGFGENEDLDDPEKKKVSNFDLFIRLMNEKKYEGLLFGEISAMTLFNRSGSSLTTILKRTDLHHRLVNGSDYPLPAINFIISTKSLMDDGYITKEERQSLNEIYNYNPLLFDFVLKRTIKALGSGEKFPASVFMSNPNCDIRN